jgi:hypothetical protein
MKTKVAFADVATFPVSHVDLSVSDPHHLDGVSDSTYHSDADPDSDFYLMRMRIRIRLFTMMPIWIRIQISASK